MRATFKQLTGALQFSSNSTTINGNQPLMVSFTGHLAAITSTPLLNKSNYLHVHFWTQDKYKTWERLNSARLQGALCKHNNSTSLLWLKDQDRKTFSKDTTSAILQKVYAIWQGFKQCGIAPPTWSAATDKVKKIFYSKVVATFPQLHLCANN